MTDPKDIAGVEPTELEIALFNGTVYREKPWGIDVERIDEDATDAIMMRAHDEILSLKSELSEARTKAIEDAARVAKNRAEHWELIAERAEKSPDIVRAATRAHEAQTIEADIRALTGSVKP